MAILYKKKTNTSSYAKGGDSSENGDKDKKKKKTTKKKKPLIGNLGKDVTGSTKLRSGAFGPVHEVSGKELKAMEKAKKKKKRLANKS